MASALTDLITETSKSRHQLARLIEEDNTVEDAFFQTCALRMKKLPAATKSYLQLQITQLFANAENPQLPPLPITPLPGHSPMLHTPSHGLANAQMAYCNQPIEDIVYVANSGQTVTSPDVTSCLNL